MTENDRQKGTDVKHGINLQFIAVFDRPRNPRRVKNAFMLN